MNIRSIIFLLFLSFFLVSCGTVNVFVKPGASFSKKTTITIINGDDSSNTKGELEFLLLSRGFNIVSESTARTALKYKGSIKGDDKYNNEFKSEVYSIKELNSIYTLETNYSDYWDVFYYSYRKFSAKVTDLNTGEIVLTVKFSGDRSVSSVLEDLANQISALVSE